MAAPTPSELPVGLDERRRHARSTAARRAVAGVGTSWFDDGCVALAVVGVAGPAQVRALRELRPQLAREAWAELVIDLSHLDGECGPALVRVLGQLRVQRLTAGARVEVHGAPAEAVAELGDRRATEFTVREERVPTA
ncbi:hypothetical protein GCM10023201_16400 [Actinomycetospora corticicola]|uniref:STAS domain-containing protein n=1 Tax=Actinomycetospora corticicola TaxID=663602 RepID=A0A7Y9DVJ7_9PSEU|nr:hypothetical protein [Actinomycetospora corticicola]NYD36002.1 hypothetical protein [Actinomycetospora corticicola]